MSVFLCLYFIKYFDIQYVIKENAKHKPMNCSTCNFELERVKRKKYQRILFPNSRRYFCSGCNKKHLKFNLLSDILSLFKFNLK